jgi:hypothetical protein
MVENKIILSLKKNYCSYHHKYEAIENFTLKNGKYINQCNEAIQYYKKYHQQYRRGNNIDNIIKVKIRQCILGDNRHNRHIGNDYITLNHIKNLINEKNCPYCGITMKFINFDDNDTEQFTINRLDDNLPHNNNNINICCLSCNIKRGIQLRTKQNSKKCKFFKELTNEIIEFNSIREASNQLGIDESCLSRLSNGKYKKSWSSLMKTYVSYI